MSNRIDATAHVSHAEYMEARNLARYLRGQLDEREEYWRAWVANAHDEYNQVADERDALQAELALLRPIANAAHGERAAFIGIEPIWAEYQDPVGNDLGFWFCRVCSEEARPGEGVDKIPHTPDTCAALAMDAALAAHNVEGCTPRI